MQNMDARCARALAEDLALDEQLKLAGDPSEEVRYTLATNPRLGVEVQRVLSLDPNEMVRASLAFNAAIGVEVQEAFLSDSSETVLAELALNPNLGEDLILQLARHERSMVRWGLVQREHLIEKAALILASDESPS